MPKTFIILMMLPHPFTGQSNPDTIHWKMSPSICPCRCSLSPSQVQGGYVIWSWCAQKPKFRMQSWKWVRKEVQRSVTKEESLNKISRRKPGGQGVSDMRTTGRDNQWEWGVGISAFKFELFGAF